MGDLLGIKGMLVNFVVRRVKKMVPDWSLPGHVKFNDALKIGAGKTFKPAKVGGDDIAFLQYTGGTTGIAKGAVLLHRNVLANVAQNALWVQDAYSVKPKPANLTYICVLPLYHIFALTINALMGMQQGAHNIMIPNPRDIPGFVKELKKYPIHIFPGLNTLFNALLNNDDFRQLDFKPLILTLAGGMAVQRVVAERWKEVTGCSITEGYGLSETSPVATANKFTSSEFTGTIGLPLPSTEITIRDEHGKDLEIGEVGEILIRGPQVMAGYWNRPDETAKVMTKDGYFTSGDLGFMDEKGYVKIVDRKKDMIVVSGFKVFPNELEDVIARHPGVLEVAAIGVPDERSGEATKLFVVKKDPKLTVEELFDYCKANFTGYKRPKYIEFRPELPKTNVGKILRRELRGKLGQSPSRKLERLLLRGKKETVANTLGWIDGQTDFKNVGEYLATLSDHDHELVQAICNAIQEAVPEAEEVISYQLRLDAGRFSGHQPLRDLLPAALCGFEAFKSELAPYETRNPPSSFPRARRSRWH